MKYVQKRIIQEKMSGGDFKGGIFSWGNCPDGNYLGVIVQGVVVLREFHRGQLSERQLSRGNYCGVIDRGAKFQGVIVLGGFHGGAIIRGSVVQGEIIKG